MRTSINACALATIVLFGCASTPHPPPEPEGVEVTILIYSGRPNPRFLLDEAAAKNLGRLLAGTQADDSYEGATVTPSILGYQGMIVVNGSKMPGLPDAMAVYHDKVEVHDGDATRFRTDAAGGIEQFLLDTAVKRKAISADERKRVR